MMNSINPTIAILADFPLFKIDSNIPIPSGPFGVWFSALYESKFLPSQWDIHWIILHRKTAKSYTIKQNNHTFHILPQTFKYIGVLTGYFNDRHDIKKLLATIKPDLVHAWGTEHAYALSGSDFKGCRLLSMQGIITAYLERSKMPYFYHVQQFWEKIALKKYSTITVESPWGRDCIKKINPLASVSLIEYGVEPLFMDIPRDLPEQPVCLYGGVLSNTKGSETLIDIFSKPSMQHIQLRIAGTGENKFVQQLRQKATSNITFLGPVSRDDLAKEMKHTWCLIHPTLADTSPNIVKEARYMGIPVVSTPEGGQTQYIEHNKSGFICQVNDSDAMAQAILKLVNCRDTNIEMGKYGLEECRNALKPELTANKLIALYKKILQI